jgi:hypothetical protein
MGINEIYGYVVIYSILGRFYNDNMAGYNSYNIIFNLMNSFGMLIVILVIDLLEI